MLYLFLPFLMGQEVNTSGEYLESRVGGAKSRKVWVPLFYSAQIRHLTNQQLLFFKFYKLLY